MSFDKPCKEGGRRRIHTPAMFSVGEDWVFLAILGIIVATISFCMDYLILVCNQVREHREVGWGRGGNEGDGGGVGRN